MTDSGSLLGEIRNVRSRTDTLTEAVVLDARIVGSRVEAKVEMAPTERAVWAELVSPVGGAGGAGFRVPTEGDSVLVGMIDGEPAEAFVFGWLHDGSSPAPSGASDGTTYLWAPAGEPLELTVGEGSPTVRVEPNGDVKIDAQTVSVVADDINLGSEAPGDSPAMNSKVMRELSQIQTFLTFVFQWFSRHATEATSKGSPVKAKILPGETPPTYTSESVKSETVDSE